jgi:hypothetical protein
MQPCNHDRECARLVALLTQDDERGRAEAALWGYLFRSDGRRDLCNNLEVAMDAYDLRHPLPAGYWP